MKQKLPLKTIFSFLFYVGCLPLFAQTETNCFTMSDLTTGKSSVDYRFGIKNPASDPVTWGWIKTDPAVDAQRKALMTTTATDTLFESLSVLPSDKDYSIRLASPNYVTHQLNDSAKGAEMRFTYTVAADKSILLLSYAVGLEMPENMDFAKAYPRYGQPWCAFYVVDNDGKPLNPAKVIEHYPSKDTSSVAGWYSVTDKRGKTAIVKDWSTAGIDMSDYVGQTVTVVMRYHDGAAKDFDAATNTLTICREKLLAHVYAYLDCAEKAFTLDCSAPTLTAPEGFNYAWTVDGMKKETTTATYTLPANRTVNVKYSCQLSNNINCLAENFTLDTIIYANNTTDGTSIRESELPFMWTAGDLEFVASEMDLGGTRTHSKSVTKTNTNGCDSTMTYTLVIYPTTRYENDTTVCDNQLPYVWEGITWTTHDSIFRDTLVNSQHGDSIIELRFKTQPCDCEEFKGTLEVDEPLCADAKGLRGFLRAVQGLPASYSIVYHNKDSYGILEDLFDQPLLASVEQELFIPFVSGRIQPNISVRMTTC